MIYILALLQVLPGRVAQSVSCLTIDVCLTADPGVLRLILAWSHTFVEIDNEIFFYGHSSTSADLFKMGFCHLQAKVCVGITGKPLAEACPIKSVVR